MGDYLETLRWLKNDFSSEIPTEIMHNIGETHKVSSGWFQKVAYALRKGIREGRIIRGYAQEFYDYLERTRFRDRLTKREDIEFVDSLLERVIEEASK